MLELNFSPFPALQTGRLNLRCIRMEDAQGLYDLRSDDRMMQFLDRPPFKMIREAEEFIQEKVLNSLEKNDGILWVIELKSDPGKIIGTTGFWRFEKEHYRTEIGYMLHADHWRQGIMKEAVIATIDWLFANTEVHSIEANINPKNSASASLLERMGFLKEAYFRENYFFNGIFKDSIIYSMIRNINYPVPKPVEKN